MRYMLSAVAVGALACGASADTIQVDTNAYSAGNGGEFTVNPVTGFAGLTGLPADLGPTSFETFCLELSENFSPGSTLSFVIGTSTSSGDPLDDRTAYLYTYFRLGILSGFDYTPGGRQASAGALQDAIWFIEGEAGAPSGGSAADDFVQLANAAVAVGGDWFGMGLGDVRILQNWKEDDSPAQDMLTLIPAPGALALLAMSGIVGLRRRRD